MEELKVLLDKYINDQLEMIRISNPKSKEEGKRKIEVRPVLLKGNLIYQTAEYKEKKVYHQNLEREEALDQVIKWMEEFKQMEVDALIGSAICLVSKKGKITIKEKKACKDCKKERSLEHNRKKEYILDPSKKIPFLMDLGIQTKDGKIAHAKYDKFKQMNRFLEIIEDVVPALPKDRELVMIDFGCGKSYLTFAMYYYLREIQNLDVRIIGLDLKEDVIAHCNELRTRYEYEKLDFFVGDIADYEGVDHVDMVVTLHACDTATDYALDKAVRWGAEVILSVPCCQHELNKQIENKELASVLKYGLIKERMAALLTDALRGNMLEEQGYQVQIMEFIDMEHTPKNILIRGIKNHKSVKAKGDYRQVMEFFHADPTLYRLQMEGREDEEREN